MAVRHFGHACGRCISRVLGRAFRGTGRFVERAQSRRSVALAL